MLDNYEKFKKDVYALTKIDLNCYKEKQMRRRIDTLINKNGITSYDAYVDLIKKDKEKFEQFVNFLTINVSEFYRNPEQWKILEGEVFNNPEPAGRYFCVLEETKCIFRAVCCIKYSCDHCVTGDTYNNTRIYKKFNG